MCTCARVVCTCSFLDVSLSLIQGIQVCLGDYSMIANLKKKEKENVGLHEDAFMGKP